MMHKAWRSTEEMPYCFSMSSVKFRGHAGQKIADFDPNKVLPDCNSNLNSLMAMTGHNKLQAVSNRCPIVFRGHPSNFKVTRDKKSPILTQIGRLWTVTPIWIHWGLWKDAQSLKQYSRSALLFFKVIHQISRTKNGRFWPELSVSGL